MSKILIVDDDKDIREVIKILLGSDGYEMIEASNGEEAIAKAKEADLIILDTVSYTHLFLKSEERGKCFIEYISAENAWNPIVADGYMYINCLWVAGSFKGHGYSTDLLKDVYKRQM